MLILGVQIGPQICFTNANFASLFSGHSGHSGSFRSNIRHKDFRPSFVHTSVTLRVPSLDSEIGWTGEFWLKPNLLKWKKLRNYNFSATKFLLQVFRFFENKVKLNGVDWRALVKD